MERISDAMGMLDLMVRPGFFVKDNRIVKVNRSAAGNLINEGTDISDLLVTGKEEYAAFEDGCLYLTLSVAGQIRGASVTRMGDLDVFILEQEADQTELQAMALAAQELREPLSNVMTTADRLFPIAALQDDPATQEQVARLNRGLFQMLRVISNMSDANRYSTTQLSSQEVVDVGSLLKEVFSKAQSLVRHAGITLTYTDLQDPIYTLADSEKLERAVLNILSNAIKFTPKGGTIEASLTRRGNMLYLTVLDNGSGIPENIKGTIHSRYLRGPVLDDGRFGIGLGMVLIRSAATHHGGTVLIDHPSRTGTRITMTLAIRQNQSGTLRSSIHRFDYAGERDHALLELSGNLPHELYDTQKLN